MKALIIHRDMMPALLSMRDADLAQIIRCSLSLVADERDEPPEDPALAFAWAVMRTKILETGKKYDEECQRRADRARTASLSRHHPDRPPAAFAGLRKDARACHGMPSGT